MEKKTYFPFYWISKKTAYFLVIAGLLVLPVVILGRFNITGSYEGLFLLKGKDGALFEVKDDLYLGEANRYIAGIDFEKEKLFLHRLFKATAREPYLSYEWNETKGAGFVRSYFPGGKQMLTCFSRFLDDGDKEAAGLFVGGGLPANVKDDSIVKENETGMAFFNGERWFHIWCNVNEGILTDKLEKIYPSSWKYLGSRVLHQNDYDLIFESSHEVLVDSVPLRVDRRAHFRAGETYFVLRVSIQNIGNRPTIYYYFYGDEPWLGNYGTAGGNVGWAADGLHDFEGLLNTKKYHYAGIFDYGNDAIGEGHHYTLTANFIEWFGVEEPVVWFSNGPLSAPGTSGKKVPLSSNERFFGIQWGPRTLEPRQSDVYTLAIGMAGRDQKTGFPVKPETDMSNFP